MVTRIKGNKLSFLVDSNELKCDATSVLLAHREAEGGVTTFCDAAGGGSYEGFFTVGSIQSTDTSSWWSYVWEHPGEEVAFRYAVHENAIATADQPHVLGTLRIPGQKGDLGGPAGTEDQTFEVELVVIGETTLDRGVSSVPALTSAAPAGQSVGEQILIAGTRFTGTTGVTIDGITAQFTVISDSALVALIPVAAAGPSPVVVTNGTGPSSSLSYTVV